MLTQIREGSKGLVAGIILGGIIITFALFGIGSYFEGGAEKPIATVGGEEISYYTYQNQLAQQTQSLAQRFGTSPDPELLRALGINQQVVDGLINAEVMDQYLIDQNYRLSDQTLSDRIIQNPAFHTEGKFDPELYQRILAGNRLSPQQFEASERQTAVSEQLRQAITNSAFNIDNETNRLLSLQTQTRDVDYAIIPANRYIDEFEISEEQAKQHYDDNLDTYQQPARIKVEYLDLSVEQIAAELTLSETDIAQTYERIKGRFKVAGVRKAAHILFTIPSDADDTAKASVLSNAQAIKAQIDAGGDYAELAKANSEDPGSATNGGDLGIITKGMMSPSFENAVFTLSEGEISEPIETPFGYHIIKLTELAEEQQQPLEEIRTEVEAEAKKLAAEDQYADAVEIFESLIFEQDDSLVPAADELGLTVQTSDWFTQDAGEGIASEALIRRAAFEPEVLEDDVNSAPIELGFDRIVAVRKLDYEVAAPKSFESVKNDIIAQLKQQASEEKVAEQAKTLLEGLTHRPSWDIRLTENNLKVEKLAATKSEVTPSLSALADKVFAEKTPTENPTYGQIILNNGDAALYALHSVTQGDITTLDEATKTQLQNQLITRDGSGLFQGLISHLRNNAEVTIDESQL